MKFWGGGQENKNIPVTFRPTEFSVSDQLVDLEGGSAEMESDNLLHKDWWCLYSLSSPLLFVEKGAQLIL